MMGKLFGILLIVLMVLLGTVFLKAFQKAKMYQNTGTPTPIISQINTNSPTPSVPLGTPSSPTVTVLPSPEPIVKTRLVSIDVDNNGTGMAVVHAPKGWRIKITLHAMSVNVDPQGLRFRSAAIDSGVILPGASQTIDFIAEQSFTLTPYAVSTGTVLPYAIQIVVQ